MTNSYSLVKTSSVFRIYRMKMAILKVWVRLFPREYGPVIATMEPDGCGTGDYHCLKHNCNAYECACAWVPENSF